MYQKKVYLNSKIIRRTAILLNEKQKQKIKG